MKNSINEAMKELLDSTLCSIEKKLDCDVLTYYGPIVEGYENALLEIIEELGKNCFCVLIKVLTNLKHFQSMPHSHAILCWIYIVLLSSSDV